MMSKQVDPQRCIAKLLEKVCPLFYGWNRLTANLPCLKKAMNWSEVEASNGILDLAP